MQNDQFKIVCYDTQNKIQMVRIIENYTLYEVIGEGAYGRVYRATNKLDNKEYAVKVIEVKKFQSNKKLQECTVNQINILTNIEKNQHIIAYYDMLKTQNNFYFIYEFCNGGTLEGILRKNHTIDQKGTLLILKQLLQAFKLLNKYNIMHRDLKPDNIFFHNGVLKVGDFGFCKSLEKAKMTKTMLGSPIYMAPEILKGEVYSTKADIWSIGVVLYEMLYGYCPFESTSIPKLIEVLNETELQFPQNIVVSTETKELLKKILTKDPTRRIQWMELFQQKITNEGKLQKRDRSSLIDQQILQGKKLYREVSETNTQDKAPSSPQMYGYNGQKQKNYSYVSPRNTEKEMGFSKKNISYDNTTATRVEKGQSPQLRKAKSTGEGDKAMIKQKILGYHYQLIKGIGVTKGIVASNEKYSAFFAFYLLKNILDRLYKFKEDLEYNLDLKEILNIVNKQIMEVQNQINNLKGKVEETIDWKRLLKARIEQSRNIKLCYEMVMFLLGEIVHDNLTTTEMQNIIRNKLIV